MQIQYCKYNYYKIVFCTLLILFSHLTFAQDKAKYEADIATLASPNFHGRGYVLGGDSLAADFIATRFKALNLEKFGTDYYQNFSFPVNTFPTKVTLSVNGKSLRTGIDYNCDAGSPSIKGRFKTIGPDTLALQTSPIEEVRKCLIVVNKKDIARLKSTRAELFTAPKGIIELHEKKLSFTVSTDQDSLPKWQVLASVWPKKVKKVKVVTEAVFKPKHNTKNVIGFVKGSLYPDSFVAVTAHFDHLGHEGATIFPGANDNASGTAFMLSLAEWFAKPENRPVHSVVFMGFAGEEAGLLGSAYYVRHPLFPLRQMKALLNLDLMGNGQEGYTVVNGSVYRKLYDCLEELTDSIAPEIKVQIRGKAANSDHYYFGEAGVPSIFVYTKGGSSAYHDPLDVPKAIESPFFQNFHFIFRKFCMRVGYQQKEDN